MYVGPLADIKKKWYEANLEAARASHVKWYEANLDSTPTTKHWYEIHEEKYSDTKKKWYEANLEAARTSYKKHRPWYNSNLVVDPHMAAKKKWYKANLAVAKAQDAKKKWYEANLQTAREGQKKW